MIRALLAAGSTLCLIAGTLAPTAAEARGRLGIHPDFAAHAGGMRAGAGGAGTLHTLPGRADGGVQRPAGAGTRSGGVRPGSDDASRGPPRPGPEPDPRPGPGPGPRPGPPPPRPPMPPPPPPPAWGWGPYWDWYDDDLAWGFAAGAVTGAAIGAAAASSPTVVTIGPVGTVIQVLPPGCTATVVGSVTYEHCGSDWLKPQYVGTTIQYVVVAPPG